MTHSKHSVQTLISTKSNRTAEAAREVLEGRSRRGFFRRILPFLGPAFIASIAYIDPGNFATNIQIWGAIRLPPSLGSPRKQRDGLGHSSSCREIGDRIEKESR